MTGRARALAFLAVAAGIGASRRWVGAPLRVHGAGLAPAVENGDVLWVWKTADALPGDLVRVRYPGEATVSVGRLVAAEGQRVELRAGALWIDGHARATGGAQPGALWGAACAPRPVGLVEEQLGGRRYWTVPGGADHAEVVPQGHVFVLHDQRGAPGDSRQWGSVPAAAIEGTLGARLWRRIACVGDLPSGSASREPRRGDAGTARLR